MVTAAGHHHRPLQGRRWWSRAPRWAAAGPERGSILISATWTIPFALGLFVLGMQMVMWFWCRDQALQAAQIDLTIARSYQGSADEGQAQAQAYLAGQDGASAWLAQPSITTDRGDVTTVTVRGKTKTLIPGLALPVTIQISGATENPSAPGETP